MINRSVWILIGLLGFPLLAQAESESFPEPQLYPVALPTGNIRAQLTPHDYTTLAAEIGAKIGNIALREGDSFKKGDLLIKLDCEVQQAMKSKANADLAGAKKVYAANKRLSQLNAVGKLELDTAWAAMRKAEAELTLVRATLSKCSIKAPFNGRVADQYARQQQYVQAGEPLLDILDDSVLELEFIVPSKWLAWLKKDHKFDVLIDETGKEYKAAVSRTGARVDPISQSVKIVAVIESANPELMPGMSGRVLLTPPEGLSQQ
ncbi:efflux RND transporter periplasmic adaptor subunit [Amphritea balenae]|uniref:Efflux RND transporter periplasmic adaptor subunit n=1 Tax=Amphritea balenae TaxID=452629 RepID=A0A3P1SSJ5_9GAMM|nr:efflux RND transporter periplasmic adaptor subunit [Amphritea balenae]RRC99152.1 efflux RND transporter periplasmic adaptor subunit [Amphritea balenae]GGK73540.1 hypothetical protein GCM10007941_24450 [Amphritea balenae]